MLKKIKINPFSKSKPEDKPTLSEEWKAKALSMKDTCTVAEISEMLKIDKSKV